MSTRISNIFIVDEHPLIRGCLSQIISDEADMESCGEADGMSQALHAIKQLKPDLVLTDLSLSDGSGVDLISHIRAFDRNIPILVASMGEESIYADKVMAAGAKGYISKDEPSETLVGAIRQVLGGEIYLSENMRERQQCDQFKPRLHSGNFSQIESLSNRELTVFDLLGQGLSNSLIAEKLSLSIKTVEAHQSNIKKKLGISSARDLIRKATIWFVHEDKYRILFENMSQGVFYQRADGRLVDCNPALLDMFGLTREQFLGRKSTDPNWKVVNEDGSILAAEQHPSMQALQTGKPVHDAIAGVFNPVKKKYVWLSINAIPLFKHAEDRPCQVFVTLHDITERKEMEERLEYLSTHDPLTGLCNRTELGVRIADEVHRATRYGHPLSVYMLDIDHFKRINDIYGHLMGDRVLEFLADTLKTSIREEDLAARYGGEEFVILLPETSFVRAREFAQRLFRKITALRIPLPNGKEIDLTVSIGIASFPEHASSWTGLLEMADKAMYRAKQEGRNQICAVE